MISSAFLPSFTHVADYSVHFVEGAEQRNHADRHNNVLQLICKLSKLTDGFCEIVKTKADDVGVSCNHGFGSDDLTDKVHQMVKLSLVNADKTLLDTSGTESLSLILDVVDFCVGADCSVSLRLSSAEASPKDSSGLPFSSARTSYDFILKALSIVLITSSSE